LTRACPAKSPFERRTKSTTTTCSDKDDATPFVSVDDDEVDEEEENEEEDEEDEGGEKKVATSSDLASQGMPNTHTTFGQSSHPIAIAIEVGAIRRLSDTVSGLVNVYPSLIM